MAQLFIPPYWPWRNSSGDEISAAKAWFTLTGTNTPAVVYTDADLTTPLTNPVATDASGRLASDVYLDDAVQYRVRIYEFGDAIGVDTPLEEYDPYNASGFSALAEDGGSLLIKHKSGLANTYGRTLRQWATLGGMDDGNIFNWIDDDLDAAVLARTNTANLLTYFQNAAAGARGTRLRAPEASYLIDATASGITLEEVALVGEGPLDGANAVLDRGSIILVKGTANSPFKVRRGTTVNGLTFYYPDQPDSATPTAFPPLFAFDFTNGAVQFVELSRNAVLNAYKFADINDAGGAVGHVEIMGNYICALNRGIYLRNNAEHFRIERNNFTFGHWLAATEAGAAGYMRANATAFQCDQGDGVEFTDNLVFGHLNGVLAAAQGLCQFMKINDNKFDQARFGVKATGAGNFDGIIGGNTFACFNSQNHALQGRAVHIDTAGSGFEGVLIEGNKFNLATEEHIYVSGNAATREITLGANSYYSWGAYKAAGAYGALNINGAATNLDLNGGRFTGTNAAYTKGIVGSMNTTHVAAAVFDGMLAALDISANDVTTAGNRSYNTGGATSDVISATTITQTGNKWDKPSGKSTRPAFLARKNASQTFNSTSLTDTAFAQEDYDKGANFATPTFTAPEAGRYRFEWALQHDATGTAGDRWQIILVTSGGSFAASYKMIADVNTVNGAAEVELAAAGTAVLRVQRVSGAGNFVTVNDSNANYFSGSIIQ
jgi:hypothetical protein